MDDEHLILLVSENECLFNKRSPLYLVQDKKTEVWRAIAAELGSTEEICRQRWKSLRERYTKEYRKSITKSSGAYREWHLLQAMQFLQEHIVARPNRQVPSLLEPMVVDPLKLEVRSPPPPSPAVKRTPRPEPITQRIPKESDNETLRGFGIMMLGIIGSMSERKQLIAMQRITDVITNLKLEADEYE